MGIDYTCEDCGGSTATLDENVLHDLVRDICAGDEVGAFRNLDILVADLRNANALQERIAIAKAAI